MSTPLVANRLVQLRIWSQMAPAFQAAVNSAWYVVSSVGSPPAFDTDFADYMDGQIAPVFIPLLNNIAEYRGVQVIQYGSIGPYVPITKPVQATANAGNGTGGAVPLPYQTAGILKFVTDTSGPAGRGRFYLPFPSQSADSGGGSCSAAYGAAGLLLGAEVGIGIALAVGGRSALLLRMIVHGKNKDDVFPPPSPVIDWQMSNLWATQKRRGSFGRQNLSPI